MPFTRTININFLSEIAIRIFLFALFYYMDTSMTPFIRTILPYEMETLKHPRIDSYVPASMLWLVVIGLPCLVIVGCWLFGQYYQASEFFMAWSLAFGLTGVLTDTMKYIVGRPRPDFFYRCYPDGVVSKDGICTGDPQDELNGRVSFPSGHSSLSFCSLGIISLWLCGQLKVASRGGSGVRVVICGIPLFAALCIGMSRSCDNHHHWDDILVGSILGVSLATICYRQYFHSLTSDLAGIPYAQTYNPLEKEDLSPERSEGAYESTPLINGRKEDKWI